jgi:hypothetical protein
VHHALDQEVHRLEALALGPDLPSPHRGTEPNQRAVALVSCQAPPEMLQPQLRRRRQSRRAGSAIPEMHQALFTLLLDKQFTDIEAITSPNAADKRLSDDPPLRRIADLWRVFWRASTL